jgi:gamma-glutamyl-gamma-aminobutyrate hydrolase PuuD
MSGKIALAFRDPAKAEPYERALRAAGLDPVAFIPDAHRPRSAALNDSETLPQPTRGASPLCASSLDRLASLDGFDGLVLTGGSDIDPALYGAEKQPECGEVDRERDDFESSLLREALARDLPVLAICRGMQLFNVVRGGTLIQHLPSTPKHRQRTAGAPVHDVVLSPPLAGISGANRIPVNSRHHQAIDRLGEGLVVAARDPEDGVIEGFVLPGARFAIGVQWHPEDMVDAAQKALFAAFAEITLSHGADRAE